LIINRLSFFNKNFASMYTYDTLSAATNGLRARGYSLDFNLAENCLICQGTRFDIEDFEIVEVYRFEGNTDPGDQSIVYAIEGKDGQKGVLVSGYGISAEGMSAEMARKLSFHRD
jgi:hypothetical protein